MVQDIKEMYNEHNESSGRVAAPAAGQDLLVIEHDQDGKLELIEIGADEANWFDVIVRKQDASSPTTVKSLRLNGDGQLIYEESFEKPIMSLEANKEIAIQNVNAGTAGKVYAASMKVWERRT